MAKYGVDGFGAWALKCNPDTTWDLDSFLRDGNRQIEGWSVPSKGLSKHMSIGDPVVFWVSGNHSSCPPGIWAIGKVAGGAHPDSPDQYWIEAGANFYVDVDVTVHRRICPRATVKADPILSQSTLIKRLFGGIWEVMDRRPEPRAPSYTVALRHDLMGPFIRRLIIRHRLLGRNIRRSMETVLATMSVSSILEEPFSGDPFPGHDRITHSLADLQTVVAQARADWRIALESMKGVYVINDKETGRRYVGSAYGDTGIWQRWATYAATLHGGNVGLRELVDEMGEEYYRTNMRFALLEYWSMRADDAHVLEREGYWKEVLHARSLGHNRN